MTGIDQILVLVSIGILTAIVWLISPNETFQFMHFEQADDGWPEVKRFQINEAFLIETNLAGSKNFALTTPQLDAKFNWKSVYLDGDVVVAFSPQCHRSEIKFDSLSLDQQAAMADAKRQFHQLETNISNEDSVFQVIQNFKNLSILEGQQARRSLVISYSMATGKVRAEQGTNFHRWNYNRHLAKLAPSIVSLGGFSLPDGMSMLFMDGDQSGLATLVYTDGRVIMKPKVCLTRPDELVAVARLAEMLEEANKKENDYLKERERQIDLKRHQKDLERSLIMEERKRQEIERKKHEHGQPHE